MSFLDHILGRPLASAEEGEQRVGVTAGIPMLGLDALSSAAYGPEAAMTVLLPLGVAGLVYIGPIIGLILGLLFMLYLSYRQTIAAYPNGGGSYTVAKENLGDEFGLLAAASLLLDYILNVAVGISAGIEALVSAVPSLKHHILPLCLLTLAVLTLVNLRGVRESGSAFILPTYAFVGTLAVVLLIGLYHIATTGGHPTPVEVPPAVPAATGVAVSLWLLMKSFASGCTAMTGVEAVSNGVSAFEEPRVETAQKTLTVIIGILALLLAGICFVSARYHLSATDPDGANYQSVISMLVAAVIGRGLFYYVTLGSVLAVLCLSANTSYAGFPRLCHLLAHDDYLPHSFAVRGRRLVYSTGICILSALAAILLVIFGGITDRLIPLFAIGAFGAFTLSQAGMVQHWRRSGKSSLALIINGVGAVSTGIALAVVLAAKFVAGAWISCLVVPAFVLIFVATRRHYRWVDQQTDCPRQMDVTPLPQPVVVVPIKGWSSVAEKALRFAMTMSPDVYAVKVLTDDGASSEEMLQCWKQYVQDPLQAAGRPVPELKLLQSPYRALFKPLFGFISELQAQYPDRLISVIVPELVQHHWFDYPLHNQRAVGLKAALFFLGGPSVVVVNVPWYLQEPTV